VRLLKLDCTYVIKNETHDIRLGFKTCLSKTKTETQDLQDQYWKSVTGMDCDKQKDWKSHGKQKIQHTSSCTQ